MRTLLVSDLHYDLRKFDWVLAEAADFDLVVAAGDFLDISSPVALDTQIVVVVEFLSQLVGKSATVVCSGNHDLDHRTASGEKATKWMSEARGVGAVVDGDWAIVDDWLVSACAWWEGPETLRHLETSLADAVQHRTAKWLWAYHGPPQGPLSWTGSTHYGDPELPRLIDHHAPDVVLCGHIHQAPYVPGGAWAERRGDTWMFNSGWQRGPVPAHVMLDLDAHGGDGRASWWSFEGSGELTLSDSSHAVQ